MLDNLIILFTVPTVSLQLLIDGIMIGAVLAIAAYGLALVWGVMNIINVTQGEYVMLGGFVAVIISSYGINPFFALPIAVLIVGLVGFLVYKTVIKRVLDKDIFTSLLATFGVSIVLQQLMNTYFGADVFVAQSNLGTLYFLNYEISLPIVKIVSLILTICIALALVYVLKYTRMGQAIRATAQNTRAAKILGIDTEKVYAFTYALNAAICGACGVLISMIYTIHAYQGLSYTLRSFTIVILAGLGNIGTVLLSSFGIATSETLAGFVLGAEFQIAFMFFVLICVLVWRNMHMRSKRLYLK